MNLFQEVRKQEPVRNPTIRIEDPTQPISTRVQNTEDKHYLTVPLLEYHPDYDTRMKFRGRAYVGYSDLLTTNNLYTVMGQGYLETPYIDVREVFIHPQDNNALKNYCRTYLHWQSLIIHPCPLPFPLFKKGARVHVVTIPVDDKYSILTDSYRTAVATCVEDSSEGGMSTLKFDINELNKGYKSVGVASIYLREVQ